MITNELLEYIKGEHSKGVSLENIKITLLENGWATIDIEEAFNTLYKTTEAPKFEAAKVEIPKTIEKMGPKITEQVKIEMPTSRPIGEIGINKNEEKKDGIVFKPEPIFEKKIEPTIKTIDTPVLGISDSLNYTNFITQKGLNGSSLRPGLININQKPKNNIGKILFIIFLFILALGSAAATYAYYNGYFVSMESVSSKTLNLMSTANSVAYDVTIDVDLSQLNKEKINNILPADIAFSNNAVFTFKGSFDETDLNNLKSNNLFDINWGPINASMETRILNNIFYMNMKKIPNLSFLGDFSNFTNKWIALPMKSEEANMPMPSVYGFSGVNSSILEIFTEEQKADLTKITEEANFIKITKKSLMEKLNNENAYHFSFTLNDEGIKTYLKNVKDYLNTTGKDNPLLASFDPVIGYDQASKYLKDFSGEAWISKKDGFLQKISINMTNYVNPNMPEEGTVSFNVVMSLKDWNKIVEIEIPSESVNFQDLMNEAMEQAKTKAIDDSVKSFMSNIAPQAETYKTANKNSYKGFCSSSLVKMSLSQFNSNLNDMSGAFCLDTKTKYIISVKLKSDTYSCVDTTGVIKEMQKRPIGLICE